VGLQSVQDVLVQEFNCVPVFLGKELKERYYKGFCKLQLWPLFHYNLPLSPLSTGRFNPDMWQAYVKANKAFADRLVEFVSVEDDFVWIHDYHLLVLPSLLRRRLNKARP
jgi:trehalose 6-phosphate synthase/phosphatase